MSAPNVPRVDSNASLESKTGGKSPYAYSSSLGSTISLSSTTVSGSSSSESVSSKTGSMLPCSSPAGSQTGLSIPSAVSSSSSSALLSSSALSGAAWPAKDFADDVSLSSSPETTASSTSLVSETFEPMSPLKESTMEERASPKDGPATVASSVTAKPSPRDAPDVVKTLINTKIPKDGRTSSFRSPPLPEVSPRRRMSAQTPIREKARDFVGRVGRVESHALDSALFQAAGKYDAKGEFSPSDQTLEDVPEIPKEKSPPLRTATDSRSSTSLDDEADADILLGGAKWWCDKQNAGRRTLKQTKKNGFEFEAAAEKEKEEEADIDNPAAGRAKAPAAADAAAATVTNVFGAADQRRYVAQKSAQATVPKQQQQAPPPPPLATTVVTTTTTTVTSSTTAKSPPTPIDMLTTDSLGTSSSSSSPRSSASLMEMVATNIAFIREQGTVPYGPTVPAGMAEAAATRTWRPTSPISVSSSRVSDDSEEEESDDSEKSPEKRERVVHREQPVAPTIGAPCVGRKSGRGRSPQLKKVDQKKKSSDSKNETSKKQKSKKASERQSKQQSPPFYQEFVYNSYVTENLHVASYDYEERQE